MSRKRRTKKNSIVQKIPIKVVEDGQGRPAALRLLDGWTDVVSVESVRDEWGTILRSDCVVKSHYLLVRTIAKSF